LGWFFGCAEDAENIPVNPGKLRIEREGIVSFHGPRYGTPDVQVLTFFQESNGPLVIKDVYLAGNENRDFRIVKKPELPKDVQPGLGRGFQVALQYAPFSTEAVTKNLPTHPKMFDTKLHVTYTIPWDARVYLFEIPMYYEPPPASSSCEGEAKHAFHFKSGRYTLNCLIGNSSEKSYQISRVELLFAEGETTSSLSLVSGWKREIVSGGAVNLGFVYSPLDPEHTPKPVGVRIDLLTADGVLFKKQFHLVPDIIRSRFRVTFPPNDCESDQQCKVDKELLVCSPLYILQQKGCMFPTGHIPELYFSADASKTIQKQTFAIHSTGDKPIKIKRVVLDEGTDMFEIKVEDKFPKELTPGERLLVTVVYTPKDSNPRRKTLSIFSDPEQITQSVMFVTVRSR
tara:strand:- start:46 stop:1245 length:1200 start_codon:yes stop_codon:yes gene_type:complete